MDESTENPLGLCPACLEKLHHVLDDVIPTLKLVKETLQKLREKESDGLA